MGEQQDKQEAGELLRDIHQGIEQLRDSHEQRLKAIEEAQKEAPTEAQVAEAVKETLEEAGVTGLRAVLDETRKQYDELVLRLNQPGLVTEHKKEDEEEKRSFLHYVRTGQLQAPECRALVQDATGLILTPRELEAGVIRSIPELTFMWPLVAHRPTNRDRILRRSLTELEIAWGGKLETGGTLSQSTQVPSEDWQYVYDSHGLAKVGRDELEDADVDLVPIIQDSFARAFSEDADAKIVVGTGTNQPTGITNGATVARVEAAANIVITSLDIMKLFYQVPAKYLNKTDCAFVMNRSTEYVLAIERDLSGGANTGQFMWQPPLQAGLVPVIRGYPVYNQDDLDEIDDTDDQDVVLFGNYKMGYRTVDRKGMYVLRLDELYVEEGMVGFFVGRRWGGSVIRADAMRILKTYS